ncbi:MAG: glycosyltransferase [Negativicutes bacterium]|nr:glycosyltransferase [Negativicutes bacterium]
MALNGSMIDSRTLEYLQKSNFSLSLWLIDDAKMLESGANYAYYDNIFCLEEDDLQYIKDKYGKSVYYGPLGYDSDIFCPDHTINRDIDLTFVGNPIPYRLDLLRQIASYIKSNSLSMTVQGVYWDNKYFWKRMQFAKKHPALAPYVSNHIISFPKVADLYRRSKICLNIHSYPNPRKSANPRTFEILATNSFQLTNDWGKLDSTIRPGVDAAIWNDNNLVEKIDYYLSNEPERKKIADSGYDWVKNKYSMTHMVQKILDTL